MIRPAGSEFLDADRKFTPTEQELERWFYRWKEINDMGVSAPLTITDELRNLPWQNSGLKNRRIVFMNEATNKLKIFQSASTDKLAMRRLPIFPNTANPTGCDFIITCGFSIASTSKNKNLAADFINFFTNDMEAQKIYNAEIGIPGSKVVQEALMPNLDPSDVIAFRMTNEISNNALPFIPAPDGLTEVRNETTSLGQMVLSNELTPAQAAKRLREVGLMAVK
jgi:ABC-type glycerol-3-phosphate transport system substrate-binding protein